MASTNTARNPNNRNLDRSVSSFDREHVFSSNGAYQLPSIASAPGWLQRVIGQWQIGGLLRMSTGTPLTLTSNLGTISSNNSTVNVLGVLPEGEGVVLADIDLERIAAVRKQLPALEHRRLQRER